MLFKSLLSPIKSITSSLVDSSTSTSHVGGSILAPLSLSTITNIVSTNTVTHTVSNLTDGAASNPVSAITGILGGVTGGSSPLSTVTNILGGVTGGAGGNPLGAVTGIIGGITGGTEGGPLGAVTGIIGGITGGAEGGPLGAVTGIIGGITGGTEGGPLGAVTGIIGGITGGAEGGPLGAVTGIIGGITGGTEGGPLGAVTGIIGGITGGDLANNPVTGVIQSGIDVLQGLESLKTDIINTGIDTVAGTIISAVHQSEHPIGDLANLGTLTFETSRDTVNGTLEAVSHLAGADLGGAAGSLTGVVGTLVNNGSIASNTVQHIIGDITNIGSTGPLGTITGIIGGITGGIGGGEGGPLGAITGIIGGITGGIGGGEGGPLGAITDIIGGITGGDLGNNPVTGVIQSGIDVLQGVESLKTDIINTGISTVGGAISGVLPGVHPVTDLTNLGTLTFETSRDTVNGTLEAISDLAGADIGGAAGSLTGVVGTLINNGSTASGLVQHIAGDLTDVGGLIGGVTGGIGGGEGGPLGAITGIIGGITGGIGGGEGGPLGAITGIIGGITGGIGGGEGGPLGAITDIIGGITGGDLGNNPVTGVIQSGIDVLQGVESLKTDIINTGINTVGGAIGGVLPGVHPITDLTNLGTLTFETSRDTVNGTLEAISDLAGADIGGAAGSLTGVVGTLINNGSTASGLVQHIAGDLTDVGGLIGGVTGGIGGGEGGPLGAITGIIGGITGGIGGGEGGPLGAITGIIGGITGGIGGGEGGPLGAITDIIGGITGGDLGNNPVTGVIQSGIDVLQGVESLKTDIINTGINTVGGAISGVLPGVHPITDLTNLGTLTFETSRDTVNGTLEAISDLAGADIGGAAGSLTGVVGTLINNGSTASGLVQHAVGDLTDVGGLLGGIGGGEGGPLGAITGIIGGITGGIGGGEGGPLGAITGIIGGITGGIGGGEGGPLGAITDIIGGITGGIGGGEGGPLGAITGIIGGITGGIGGGEGGPLGAITDIIGGITGGDLGNNPVTGVIQSGIDVLQGVESLKTDIINTGINTVGGAIGGVLPGVHPITDLTNLGTLTFETSRDTVNGTLEAISDLAGADIGGAAGSLTGVVGTLINNGSTASDLVQHAVGDLTDVGGLLGGIGGGEGGPLGAITGIIGGITGGIGGGEGGPLGAITDIIGGITGGIGGGEGGLSVITDILGTINHGANSGDVIAGIAQPIQTVISNGNIAIDTLQDHVTTLFSDSSLDSINNLISISVGNGDYSLHGSVDGILDALTGTVTSGIAVGEPNPNGGSLTDLVSLQSPLNSLTDHLFSSVNHF
ncbi:beta strand repeat-containing protein [Acinetobacter proteolyticus]|uniref:beta strand repeat-containing protein n=1 Tax=Acinetobacter proteolyticus TaxID=1776741 RepID=UPI003D99D1B7